MKTIKTFFSSMFLLFFAVVGQANGAWTLNPATGNYYDLISTPNNFWQAQNIAEQNYDAHLVTIADAAENQWLVDTFGTTVAWIGFTDEAQEGNWSWITGEPVTYTNWASTEPNNNYFGQPENYAFTNYGAGLWADVSNGDSRYPFHALIETNTVPIPGAVWLLGSGLVALIGYSKKRKMAQPKFCATPTTNKGEIGGNFAFVHLSTCCDVGLQCPSYAELKDVCYES